jgi:hypothetical protein
MGGIDGATDALKGIWWYEMHLCQYVWVVDDVVRAGVVPMGNGYLGSGF